MNPKSKILERIVYALLIILALIAVGLVTLAPSFMNTHVVYQGF
jgi:hypothetical protein